MADINIELDLYRLNKVNRDDLLSNLEKAAEKDRDLLAIIQNACEKLFDDKSTGIKNSFVWGLRNYRLHFVQNDHDDFHNAIASVCIFRAIEAKYGLVVTEDGITEDFSSENPPSALAVRIIFHMRRHLVAVEYSSALMNSNVWREMLEKILYKSSQALGYRTAIHLEPVPQENEVMREFQSFELLNRLKVRLRLPNPEISRSAKLVYDQMQNGGIDEWLTEMKRKQGLNTASGNLPHSVASLAQAGYKSGSVVMTGYSGGEYKKVVTGNHAWKVITQVPKNSASGSKPAAVLNDLDSSIAELANRIDASYPSDDTQ